MRSPRGVTPILIATGIASVAGFAVITVVPTQIGLAQYKAFGLFWAAMYLVIGALSGVQQEITRATVRREQVPGASPNPARRFGLATAGAVFATIVVTAPLWVQTVFPEFGWALVWPLAIACSSYALVAVLAGTLYGVTSWVSLALMIAIDALLRLLALVVLAVFTDDPVVLAWGAAVPFALTIAALWPFIRRSVVGRATLDVGSRPLVWNASRTVAASTSAGVLVSGLPLVIGIAGAGEPPATVAALFVAIALTRAPLIVLTVSLQSYLVVRFRDHAASLWRTLGSIVVGIALVGGVGAVVAWLAAPSVFELLYGGDIRLPGWFYAALVVSSALLAVMNVSGPVLLARSAHMGYSTGWLAAAGVTILCFALPLGLVDKTVAAVLAGPITGIVVHVIDLARGGRLVDR